MKPIYDRATVVIPTYNRMALLDMTLASLTRSTTPPDSFQVLVADDGSSDRTREVVAKYEPKLDLSYGFQDDLGFRAAKARNMALTIARYPLLIFVDCGMLLSSGFIAAHVAAHRLLQRPAVIIGYAWGFDRNNENAPYLSSLEPADVGALIARLRGDGEGYDPREEAYRPVGDELMRLPCPWTLMWGCNFSLEADVFKVVGGFNENFTTWGAEDSELAYRLYRCGMHFALARNAEAVHWPHEKNEAVLQRSSLQNLARETARYRDPALARVLQHGDLNANRV